MYKYICFLQIVFAVSVENHKCYNATMLHFAEKKYPEKIFLPACVSTVHFRLRQIGYALEIYCKVADNTASRGEFFKRHRLQRFLYVRQASIVSTAKYKSMGARRKHSERPEISFRALGKLFAGAHIPFFIPQEKEILL